MITSYQKGKEILIKLAKKYNYKFSSLTSSSFPTLMAVHNTDRRCSPFIDPIIIAE